MRGKFGIFLLLACTLALFASVRTYYSHSADFAKYKTYSWIKVSVQDPLWEDRVMRSVDSQLTAKGWTKVDRRRCFSCWYGSRERENSPNLVQGFGGGWGWRGFGEVWPQPRLKTRRSER